MHLRPFNATLGILLEVDQSQIKGEFSADLAQSLEPYRDGDCPITVIYSNDKAKGSVKFSDNWGISPTDDLLYRLSDLPGCTNVQVKYN